MMKTNFISILIAGLLGIATATSASAFSMGERPDAISHAVEAKETKTISADRVYSSKELTRSPYDANSRIKVTVFPSSGKIDRSSAGDR